MSFVNPFFRRGEKQMKPQRRPVCALLTTLLLCPFMSAQQAVSATSSSSTLSATVVPRLVNFSGRITEPQGKPGVGVGMGVGVAGATFAIYREETGGSPLWIETQNIQLDAKGNYSVQLGATKAAGLPLDLFTSGEARWLGVRINGGEERPRVLLLSVPYALKAADAETVGGLPASAFMLAGSANGGPAATGAADATNSTAPPSASAVTTSGGSVNGIPLWTTGTNIQTSNITQSGSGSTAKIGIGTTTPSSMLDVKGATTLRGTAALISTGTASSSVGKNSQALKFTASSYNTTTHSAVNQNFLWQAEPAGNNTSNASGTLNLLFGAGSNTPAATGLKIAKNGTVTFASGQTFPGVTTSVGLSAPSSDFTVTGSPVNGSGTLALNWSVAPVASNTPNAIVKRDANGNFTGGSILASNGIEGDSRVSTGVFGKSGSGTGVYGYSSSFGVWGESSAYDAVYGLSHSGYAGVLGKNDSNGYGVWGTTSSSGSGVAGYNYSSGPGVYAYSASGYALYAHTDSDSSLSGYFEGPFGGYCEIDDRGNFKCSGSKSAVVPVDNGARQVALYAVEAPENWFEDFGSGRLANGEAVIHLEPTFAQTVNTGMEYHVFPVPNGDCKGLYVAEKTANGFVVRELGGGRSNITFDYRIIARRKGYETIRLADNTREFKEAKAKSAQMREQQERMKVRPVVAAGNEQHK